jgi:Shikimate / quinate 5-dehydrogenase
MLPRLGVGGGTPTPRKLKAASANRRAEINAGCDGDRRNTLWRDLPRHDARSARTDAARRRRLAVEHPTLLTRSLERLPFVLPRASVLVCATAARQPIVDCRTIRDALANRPQSSLVILDLAMPRAVEPAARAVPGVRLIDLDDLEQLSTHGGPTRSAIADRRRAWPSRS